VEDPYPDLELERPYLEENQEVNLAHLEEEENRKTCMNSFSSMKVFNKAAQDPGTTLFLVPLSKLVQIK